MDIFSESGGPPEFESLPRIHPSFRRRRRETPSVGDPHYSLVRDERPESESESESQGGETAMVGGPHSLSSPDFFTRGSPGAELG